MRRVTVQNAFQVLSIFYLFVTCFCSSLNVDANVKGVLPSESPNNDSFPASHVNTKVSEEKKISDPPNIASSDGSPKVLENEKTPGSVQVEAQHEDASADIKAVPEPVEAATSTDAATNASDASTESAAQSPPPPMPSEAKKEPRGGAPNAQPAAEEKGSTAEAPAAADPAPQEPPKAAAQQREEPAAVGGPADAENATTRDREGEPPEDGSDVPTFDEYQRKFTSGGSPAKEGAGGKSGAPGDATSRREGDAAKAEDAGGGKAAGGGAAGGSGGSRQQSFKNIGSYNCGAKVISHNNEASNPAYVLNENRDEYMNNPCAVKKWIVVETCEPVRLRKIEMASYELFSSMVKTFRVSSSERFPQKMWDVVGTFVAKNEKGVQTYATEQDKYYKYFKFEFVDHYGNEHFCPVSLIRLFGVLMEDDDDDDEPPEGGGSGGTAEGEEAAAMVRIGKNKEPASRSLLQSAKEVIVGIVQNTLRPASSKEGSPEAAAVSNASSTNATGDPASAPTEPPAVTPRPAVEGPRVMHLMRLLLSGDYSGLLQRCLELLRQAPPVVHQNYVEHKVIPSPSVAFAACAKAMAQSKISAEELRWAYLTFNNDTFPWEDAGGSAAITAKLAEPQGGEKPEEAPAGPSVQPSPQEVPPKVAKLPEQSGGEEKPPVEPAEAKPAAKETQSEAEEKAGKAAVEPPKLADAPKEAVIEKSVEEPGLSNAKPQPDQLPPPPPPPPPPQPKPVDTPLVEPPHADEQRPTVPAEAPKEAETEQKAAPSEQKQQPAAALKEHDPPPQKEQQQQQQQQKEQPPPPQKEQQQQQQKQPPPPAKQQKAASSEGSNGRGVGLKENAYMRLSNKVKDLERNITISMGYLEELSRSYKKKTDKLSKQQEKTSSLLEETRAKVDKQELRIQELEAQVKVLRETYEAKGLAELRREHSRMGKEMLVQVLALNILIIVLHCLVLFLCRRRCCRPSPMAVNGAAASIRAMRAPVATKEDAMEEPWPLSHSNSDSNLCIVDPPFRFDDNLVKKYRSAASLSLDSKKRRKKKRSNAGVHPIPDRSASVSRIEQLMM